MLNMHLELLGDVNPTLSKPAFTTKFLFGPHATTLSMFNQKEITIHIEICKSLIYYKLTFCLKRFTSFKFCRPLYDSNTLIIINV